MLTRIKKMLGFGELVDEARKGNLSRRGLLQAAVALGVGAEEAHGALHKRVYAAPKLVTMPAVTVEGNPWFDRWEGMGDVAGVWAVVMSVAKDGDKWRFEWNAAPVPGGSADGIGVVEAAARKVTKYHHPRGGFIEIAETPMVKP